MSDKIKVCAGVAVAVVVLIIVLIALSLGKLDSDEIGLMYDPVQHRLEPNELYEGLHNGPPGFSFIKFSSVFKTLGFYRLQCLNKDGVEIILSISFQYRIKPRFMFAIISQFRDQDSFENLLDVIGQSSIHDACSKFNTSQFQSERGAFQEEVRKRIVRKYNEVATDVTDLQVNDITRPSRYENSVKSKESAREDIVVARNERPQRLTEAETVLREAETQSVIDIQRAESEARILLNKARSEAEATLNDYEKEAESYKILKDSLEMTPEGMLAYLAVRVISDSPEDVNIGLRSPARTAWYS